MLNWCLILFCRQFVLDYFLSKFNVELIFVDSFFRKRRESCRKGTVVSCRKKWPRVEIVTKCPNNFHFLSIFLRYFDAQITFGHLQNDCGISYALSYMNLHLPCTFKLLIFIWVNHFRHCRSWLMWSLWARLN